MREEMAVTPDEGEIQLVLSDKLIPISGQESQIEYDAKGTVAVNSEKIADVSLNSANSSKRLPEFNQLIVPNGKRSTLILEDGTKLWVNAGSRIVYPVTFADKKREIYVNGEVFLEVTPDKKRPFIVKTKEMDVQVLGTSFNVMAYETDESSSVVLVTGAVQVNPSDGIFVFGSPCFKKVEMKVRGGKTFTVEAPNNNKENIYIQKVYLNGKPYNKSYITYDDIINGSTLKFVMGKKPNKNFGKAPANRPVVLNKINE